MRKFVLLYAAPWTGLIIAALSGQKTANDLEILGAWVFLFSALIFGLPHGAFDFWILQKKLNASRAADSRLLVTLVLYALSAFVVAALWFIFPTASIAAFLILTALHFGAGDQIWETINPRGRIPSLLRGLVIVSSPLAFHPAESERFLGNFLWQSQGTESIALIMAWAPKILVFTSGALLLADIVRSMALRTFPLLKWLELGIFVGFFWLMSPLFATAVYFTLVHSWRHVLRTRVYAESGLESALRTPTTTILWEFYKKAFPMTALSLIGLALIYFVVRPDLDVLTSWTSAYFILLASLTVPHAIVIEMTETRLVR